ncbi:Jjj1 protein [Starmerella bacillaris]|uniref:Jjj1 protein n=1 Tax=Starmerella bacillaris TaxID=1247836 RepID=A0AAV5RGH0_STABA|nr:Jjj1 protein [Starmerella bacillaris]
MGNQTSKLDNKSTLYDLFGVTIDVDADQLKRAYRAKALELHPDRNAHRLEEATALFAKLQAAYDLLQDSKERAWYDNQLKRPGYSTYDPNLTTAEEIRQVTRQVISQSQINFMQIAGYFNKLKHEEQEAAFAQHTDMPYYLMEAPPFGSATDNWTQVSKFYDSWSSFSTIKDFSWEDVHPLHEISDRKTRRKLEQQNKRLRESAKKDYNVAVKQAVTQLRQIDPRKKTITKSKPQPTPNETNLDNQMSALKLRESYVEQEWMKTDSTELDDSEIHECIVCESVFETEFDLLHHNKTNVHKRKLMLLKQSMALEDELLGLSSGAKTESQDQNNTIKTKAETKPLGKAKTKANKKKKMQQQMLTCGTCGQELMSDEFIIHKQMTRH